MIYLQNQISEKFRTYLSVSHTTIKNGAVQDGQEPVYWKSLKFQPCTLLYSWVFHKNQFGASDSEVISAFESSQEVLVSVWKFSYQVHYQNFFRNFQIVQNTWLHTWSTQLSLLNWHFMKFRNLNYCGGFKCSNCLGHKRISPFLDENRKNCQLVQEMVLKSSLPILYYVHNYNSEK